MCRHSNYNNVIELAIFIKFEGHMAIMAINYQHSVCASRAILCMCVEMFDLIQACLIIGPSIDSWLNNPIIWETWICCPVREMICAFYDNERRDASARCIDAFDNSSPFSIIRLYRFGFPMSIWACNNHKSGDYAYYEAGFIKIVKIFSLNSIFVHHIAQ